MERRLSLRKLVDVKVYISVDGKPVCRCTAIDISSSGIYLELNPLDVPRNTVIDLTFALHLQSSNIVRLRRVSAIITHSQSNGVGMMFCQNRYKQTA